VDDSPIAQLLGAVDEFDVEAAVAMFAPDAQLMSVDGRRSVGSDAVRELLTGLVKVLRSSAHRITAQWHQQNVWIAEVEASYELKEDMLKITRPRAFVLQDGPDGFVELHVYGAHEPLLGDHHTAEGEMRLGGRWIPPL
jgi:hypothetical protein